MSEQVDPGPAPNVPVSKKLLTAAQILAANDVATIDVFVPDWGGTIRLRSLTADEVLRFVEVAKEEKDSSVRIVAMSAVDEEGHRLFSINQVEELRAKNFRPFAQLQEAALKLSGLDKDSGKTAKNA